MNRLIIGTLMVIGMLWGVGVGQPKVERDPRLILPSDKEWGRGKTGCITRASYFANGTFIDRKICNGKMGSIIQGTWYTANGSIFQTYALEKNGTPIEYESNYSLENGYLSIAAEPPLAVVDK